MFEALKKELLREISVEVLIKKPDNEEELTNIVEKIIKEKMKNQS